MAAGYARLWLGLARCQAAAGGADDARDTFRMLKAQVGGGWIAHVVGEGREKRKKNGGVNELMIERGLPRGV